VWRLFQPDDGDAKAAAARPHRRTLGTGLEKIILCAGCLRRITTPAARIEVGGRHDHECVNRQGYRWRIGCFAAAEGLVIVTEPDADFTWFPGYTWEIENCGGCSRLIGWRYRSGDSSFHGLILAHLVEVDGEKSL
jgi:hypothetical protein